MPEYLLFFFEHFYYSYVFFKYEVQQNLFLYKMGLTYIFLVSSSLSGIGCI